LPEETVEDYETIGIRGIDFSSHFEEEFPISKIFLKLWPGVWHKQLRLMNREIESANGSLTRCTTLVSQAEWWTFIAIMVASAAFGKGGELLWRKTTEYNITGAPNVGQYMSSSRFKQIK